jgi:hypothetical protein
MKPTSKAGLRTAAEPVERRAGGRGKGGPAKHALDAELGSRVTGAGPRTSSSKGRGEGGGHRAAPARRGSAAAAVLHAQAQGGSGSGWGDVAGLQRANKEVPTSEKS